MKLFFSNQTKNFRKYLDLFKHQDIIAYPKSALKEKVSAIDINTTKPLQQLDVRFFWNYQIFPDHIMASMTEWSEEGRAMQVGDTILQQVYLPPIKWCSQKVLFGVRINRIINEDHRIGYSYETLKGHVEMGLSIFTIEKTADGKTIFKIQTFSQPGSIITRLLGSFIAIPYQTFCTRSALKNVKAQLET